MTSRLVVVAIVLLSKLTSASQAAAPPAVLYDLYGDPLPNGALARLGSMRWRSPEGSATSGYTWAEHFAFLPDGKHLATASNPMPGGGRPSLANLSLLDLRTGRLKRTIRAGKTDSPGDVYGFDSFAFTPDGKYVVYSAQVRPTGGLGGKGWVSRVLLLEVDTGKVVAEAPDDASPIQIAISPDAKFVAFSSFRDTVYLWDVAANTLSTLSKGHMFDAKHHLGFSADGKRLILVNKEILQIDVPTGKVRLRIPVHHVGPWTCAVAPGGRFVAVHQQSSRVDLHDLANGTRRDLLLEGDGRSVELSFSPDARTLVARDRELERVELWNVAEGRLRRQLHVPGLKAAQYVVRLSPDGKTLAGYEASSVPRLWDAVTGQPQARFPGPATAPTHIAFSRGGEDVVAYSYSRGEYGTEEVYRWGAATGKPLRHTALELPSRDDLRTRDDWQLSPDGDTLAARRERHLYLFDVRSGKRVAVPAPKAKYTGHAFSHDGRAVAVSRADRAVEIREAQSGRLVRELRLGPATKKVAWACFSHDERTLVTGEHSGRVHLWDAVTGDHRRSFQRPSDPEPETTYHLGWEVIPSGDGRTLAVVKSNPSDFYLWDLQAGREIGPLENLDPNEERYRGIPMAFSADGRLLACLDDERITLFEVATRRVMHRIDGRFVAAAFAPGGYRLATSCLVDATILVWDVPSLLLANAPPAKDADRLWEALASTDATLAYRAAWQLAALPEADAALGARLTPVEPLSADRAKRLIAGLASESYAQRKAAQTALDDAREAARAAVTEARRSTKDLEQRLRLDRLLGALEPAAPARLREARAIMALEARGTPESLRLMRRLAAGAPEARLTREATAALGRLSKTR